MTLGHLVSTKQSAQKRSTTSGPLCDREAQWIHDIRRMSLVVRIRVVVEGVQLERVGAESQPSSPATHSDGSIEVSVHDQERHLLADELLEIPQVNRTTTEA